MKRFLLPAFAIALTIGATTGCSDDTEGPPDSAGPVGTSPVTAADTITTEG